MTPEQFLARCRTIWHVAPAGAWERIRQDGFRTADQLIRSAEFEDAERERLLSQPRERAGTLRIGKESVTIRDQRPLLARRDLASILQDGMTVADWVRLLNTRVYFFTERPRMRTLLEKYVRSNGGQDVLTLSPLRLLQSAGDRLELAAQNTGAVARTTGVQKTVDTFLPLARFPDRRPAELTVVDGLTDTSVVVRAERHRADGTVETLHR